MSCLWRNKVRTAELGCTEEPSYYGGSCYGDVRLDWEGSAPNPALVTVGGLYCDQGDPENPWAEKVYFKPAIGSTWADGSTPDSITITFKASEIPEGIGYNELHLYLDGVEIPNEETSSWSLGAGSTVFIGTPLSGISQGSVISIELYGYVTTDLNFPLIITSIVLDPAPECLG